MVILVAERIKELMREEGLNQVRLAEKTGCRQNTISAWLLKKKEPCIASLWALADYFNVSVDYLIGRTDM
ncbi:MAG: helix-turn-helix domain-containing protein [Clostridia bacterium]|nr:helix-turn-helix domain-containing protein [Clostridia bacterium]